MRRRLKGKLYKIGRGGLRLHRPEITLDLYRIKLASPEDLCQLALGRPQRALSLA